MDTFQTYYSAAREFAERYNCESSHIHQIIASVMMMRDGVGFNGGSFVSAVVNNDLYEAVSRADSECQQYLNVIVSAVRFAHL